MTPLEELRAALDAVVVGQEEAKTGLLLALLAREHAYLVGPPGSGKTLLAEALASASGARVAGVRFHRDLRDSDLLGDAVLRIRRSEGAERLEIGIEPGALLRAEVAVLDDISRAPGEALGPLLRILAERAAPGGPIPLETAIATSSPPGDEVCADPLEPSQLDRFAIQVRMHGLVTGKDWAGARELLERAPAPGIEPVLDPDTRLELQARAAALPVAAEARAALVRLALRLAEIVSTEEASLISDRAFAIVAQRVMRAHALLREAPQADVIDLEAVRFMLAFRVPEEVQRAFSMLVDEVLHEEPPRSETMTGVERASGQVGGEASGEPVRVKGVEAPEERIDLRSVSARELAANAADVARLVRALEGRLDRGRVEARSHPGGQPRRYRAMDGLEEIFDADLVDAALFLDGRLPGTPRAYLRERRDAGGMLAVIRDVSASMEGRLSRWAGEVVAGIVRTGAKHRMRIGYLEFNHQAERFAVAGRFFHRHYGKLLALAARRRAEGRTNYEAPLRSALSEFRTRAGRNRHIVLLTDGVPVVGDPAVVKERQLAKRLGVRVHTVFLGLGHCPGVLDEISLETGGLRFVARPRPDGRVSVREREDGGHPAQGRAA
jgi:MoxR-like ATPase/Mg-chelatase subunit ChlD